MKITKKIARKYMFPAFINSGLEKIWRNMSEHSILNVLYHGVVIEDSNFFFTTAHYKR